MLLCNALSAGPLTGPARPLHCCESLSYRWLTWPSATEMTVMIASAPKVPTNTAFLSCSQHINTNTAFLSCNHIHTNTVFLFCNQQMHQGPDQHIAPILRSAPSQKRQLMTLPGGWGGGASITCTVPAAVR
jgi:hypothetical protein